jgi:hypothetical protein
MLARNSVKSMQKECARWLKKAEERACRSKESMCTVKFEQDGDRRVLQKVT